MNELNHLIQNGVSFYEKHFNVEVKCFLCDVLARSFLKGIISRTGYKSYERCCFPGMYEGRVVFNDEIEKPKRSNETRKPFEYNDHLNTALPLTEIGIDVINLLPLDYMHLVCLSAVRRILNNMKTGPRGGISANQINEISSCTIEW